MWRGKSGRCRYLSIKCFVRSPLSGMGGTTRIFRYICSCVRCVNLGLGREGGKENGRCNILHTSVSFLSLFSLLFFMSTFFFHRELFFLTGNTSTNHLFSFHSARIRLHILIIAESILINIFTSILSKHLPDRRTDIVPRCCSSTACGTTF